MIRKVIAAPALLLFGLWGCGGNAVGSRVASAGRELQAGGPCGDSTCSADQYCCNPSCGICAPYPDGVCTDQICHVEFQRCGTAVCGPREYCCNESCSQCAPFPDGVCTDQICHEEI
jgi:hypothetical protein